MPIFRADRSKSDGDHPLFLWKVRLFVVGAGLGVSGMVMEIPLLLGSGVAALLAGMLLGLAQRRLEGANEGDSSDEDA